MLSSEYHTCTQASSRVWLAELHLLCVNQQIQSDPDIEGGGAFSVDWLTWRPAKRESSDQLHGGRQGAAGLGCG